MTRRAEGWAAGLTRSIGYAVRDLRRERGLTGQQLVDALAEVGLTISRSALTNLEAARRESVSVQEVFALAAVLGVAPIRLLVPELGAAVELLPGRGTDGTRLALWIVGQGLPGAAHLHDTDEQTYAASAKPMDDLVLHGELIRDVRAAERARKGPAGEGIYLRALAHLLDLRASMAARGITAPPLPPELDYVETAYPSSTTEGES